jgi:hypothetical protein
VAIAIELSDLQAQALSETARHLPVGDPQGEPKPLAGILIHRAGMGDVLIHAYDQSVAR